jgi:hypothetical protein
VRLLCIQYLRSMASFTTSLSLSPDAGAIYCFSFCICTSRMVQMLRSCQCLVFILFVYLQSLYWNLFTLLASELSVRKMLAWGITRRYFLAPRLPSFPCGERTAAYPNFTDNSHMVFDNLQDDNPPMQPHTTTLEQEGYLSRLTPRRYSRSLRSSKRHSRISPAFDELALHWLECSLFLHEHQDLLSLP